MDELKVGCRLKIFAEDGVYEGAMHAVDLKGTGKDDRITLHKGNSVQARWRHWLVNTAHGCQNDILTTKF